MIHFKACARCQGDMQTQRDMYGTYIQCVQCGHMHDIKPPQTSTLQISEKKAA